MDAPEVLAGEPIPPLAHPLVAATLPPLQRESSALVTALGDPQTGLPADTVFDSVAYRPRLGLTAVGQPSLVAGASQFGTYVGGGVSLFWSDELGNQNLITGLQINGSMKDIYGIVAYQNMGHRLNWGVVAQQVPYLTGGFASGIVDTAGQQVYVEQQLLQRADRPRSWRA